MQWLSLPVTIWDILNVTPCVLLWGTRSLYWEMIQLMYFRILPRTMSNLDMSMNIHLFQYLQIKNIPFLFLTYLNKNPSMNNLYTEVVGSNRWMNIILHLNMFRLKNTSWQNINSLRQIYKYVLQSCVHFKARFVWKHLIN